MAAILRVKQACVGCCFTPPFNIRPATICDVMLLLMAITLTTTEPPCAHCAILPHALKRAVKHYVLLLLLRYSTRRLPNDPVSHDVSSCNTVAYKKYKCQPILLHARSMLTAAKFMHYTHTILHKFALLKHSVITRPRSSVTTCCRMFVTEVPTCVCNRFDTLSESFHNDSYLCLDRPADAARLLAASRAAR